MFPSGSAEESLSEPKVAGSNLTGLAADALQDGELFAGRPKAEVLSPSLVSASPQRRRSERTSVPRAELNSVCHALRIHAMQPHRVHRLGSDSDNEAREAHRLGRRGGGLRLV